MQYYLKTKVFLLYYTCMIIGYDLHGGLVRDPVEVIGVHDLTIKKLDIDTKYMCASFQLDNFIQTLIITQITKKNSVGIGNGPG